MGSKANQVDSIGTWDISDPRDVNGLAHCERAGFLDVSVKRQRARGAAGHQHPQGGPSERWLAAAVPLPPVGAHVAGRRPALPAPSVPDDLDHVALFYEVVLKILEDVRTLPAYHGEIRSGPRDSIGHPRFGG